MLILPFTCLSPGPFPYAQLPPDEALVRGCAAAFGVDCAESVGSLRGSQRGVPTRSLARTARKASKVTDYGPLPRFPRLSLPG
jgi:hypothetical protein